MNSQQTPSLSKQPYEAPVLTMVGSVAQLTLANGNEGGADTVTLGSQ